ncbi:uncharacterized protein MELLADRAFT_79815 [Melampsora larici-populina 98AG31]|uniref:F-box domain-containing protein n=1 Tax=Melampsora larici-populina (strain 98AG31 / pathotype 3-4-7) TaxID=747676 RepID=F4SCH2_MELLP|nr:uncharacterized protein MELLADRAFT_79815 [Melampsora larici-populina 98AG31]EGF97653.1 hypothetical protein MELLADRAFT_79815 [Melampsora larici-populina 98AG31]
MATFRAVWGLGPENVFKVLSYCENLTTLNLTFPDRGYNPPPAHEVLNLSRNLTLLFSDLKHLQHLKMQGSRYSSIFADYLIEPISHLTILESLELAEVSYKHDAMVDELNICLSKMKNLKQLVLRELWTMDGSWTCTAGPPQLVDLKLIGCDHLLLFEVPHLINSWAPHLTHLELRFDVNLQVLPWDDEEFDPDQCQVCLPDLTHLTIWPHCECHYFRCFAECKKLQHFTFHQSYGVDILDQLADFSAFITTTQFPQLKVIDIPVLQYYLPFDISVTSALVPLQTFCNTQGIELKVFPEGAVS